MGTVTVTVRDSSGAQGQLGVPYTVPITSKLMMIGASATSNSGKHTSSDLAEYLRLESITGRSLDVRRTFEAAPTSWAQCKASADVGKRASFVSFKTSPDTMAGPGQEAYWKALIESVPRGHRVYMTWQHEAENPSKNNDPAKIRAGGAKFAEYVRKYRGDRDISIAWTLMGWTFASEFSKRNPLDWYWGDSSVEVVAPDPYNTSTSKFYSFDATMVGATQAYQFTKAHGKRFGIAEWGNYDLTATNRVKFLTDGVSWLRSLKDPACEFACWFHSDVPSDDAGDYWLDSTSASLAAWVKAAA